MDSPLAIQTQALGRRFGRKWVVENLDLTVPRGAVYGLLGLNGAGKSTTIRMLMGLLRRDAGSAAVLGFDPARDAVEIKRRVGYVADATAFYDWMTVEETCAFVAGYRRGAWSDARARDLLARFKVPPDSRMRELSKGQRAKVALTLALAFGPEMLILDEPMSGLDPLARREFIEGVLGEFQESGKTVFISSHLVAELAGLVDHLGVIHAGRMAWEGPSEMFLGSVRRVRMAFENDAPAALRCEGLLSAKSSGREALVAVRGFHEARTLDELRAFGPTSLEVEMLNLEEALIEFLGALEEGRA